MVIQRLGSRAACLEVEAKAWQKDSSDPDSLQQLHKDYEKDESINVRLDQEATKIKPNELLRNSTASEVSANFNT